MGRVSGFLFVDKPKGMSSGRLVSRIRRLGPKAGHAGTLDTNASGLMVIALGEATKLLPLFSGLRKEYIAEVSFHENVENKDMVSAAKKFEGEIVQVPPRRSAVRRKARARMIETIDVLETGGRKAVLRIRCDAGVYIRTLAADMGKELGCQAHLSNLRRVRMGNIGISMASPLDGGILEKTVDMNDALGLIRAKKLEIFPGFLDKLASGSPVRREWVKGCDDIGKNENFCIFSSGRPVALGKAYADSSRFGNMALVARTDRVLKSG